MSLPPFSEELLAVLRWLLRVQQVLFGVNQQYLYSASQDDAYRTEPPFQLQGNYRNMNKLAEKIVPVKLAELRGTASDELQARWAEIKRGFARGRVR